MDLSLLTEVFLRSFLCDKLAEDIASFKMEKKQQFPVYEKFIYKALNNRTRRCIKYNLCAIRKTRTRLLTGANRICTWISAIFNRFLHILDNSFPLQFGTLRTAYRSAL